MFSSFTHLFNDETPRVASGRSVLRESVKSESKVNRLTGMRNVILRRNSFYCGLNFRTGIFETLDANQGGKKKKRMVKNA